MVLSSKNTHLICIQSPINKQTNKDGALVAREREKGKRANFHTHQRIGITLYTMCVHGNAGAFSQKYPCIGTGGCIMYTYTYDIYVYDTAQVLMQISTSISVSLYLYRRVSVCACIHIFFCCCCCCYHSPYFLACRHRRHASQLSRSKYAMLQRDIHISADIKVGSSTHQNNIPEKNEGEREKKQLEQNSSSRSGIRNREKRKGRQHIRIMQCEFGIYSQI